MEVIYLVCGARRPQLKRDPLGSTFLDMGRTKGPYQAEFPPGATVRIRGREVLLEFQRSWRYHHPLEDRQLKFAGREARVQDVGFYHGVDELYKLRRVPGTWHEACLEFVAAPSGLPIHGMWRWRLRLLVLIGVGLLAILLMLLVVTRASP